MGNYLTRIAVFVKTKRFWKLIIIIIIIITVLKIKEGESRTNLISDYFEF